MMERLELQHTLAANNSNTSYMTHQVPKTRCNHCCLHQCAHSREDSHRSTVMSFCTGNFCTQTCFSDNQPYNGANIPSCSCHSEMPHMRSYIPSPAPPPLQLPPPIPPAAASRCPCINRHHVDALEQLHRYHMSHPYLSTENVTFPAPHYAMAHFANSYSWTPTQQHTWEASRSYRNREYHTHNSRVYEGATTGSTPEYPSHHHHQHHHHINEQYSSNPPHSPHPVCTNRNVGIRDQALYTFASRPYHRRQASRNSSHPYPTHHPLIEQHFHYRSSNAYPYLLTPRLHFPSALGNVAFAGELEVEPFEGEWIEEGASTEPVGLNKEQIGKLPSYVVTKKTMEEFTENERCVVCMCEFDMDDKLRILPCAHEFHTECVDKWLLANPTCPICRAVVEIT